MAMNDLFRLAALAAVLLAGSCADPSDDATTLTADPSINHPITVSAEPKSLTVSFSAADAGLMPDDAARMDEFVSQFLTSGQGAISVTVPSGPGSQQAIEYFGERLASAGVPRSRIMVGSSSAAAGTGRVEISYVGYAAHTDQCGDWSQDAADMASNLPMPNFGCAVQHNIAAQVVDPRDLAQPRPMDRSDATRRATVMGNYEKGTPTAASKTEDQTVSVSDVK